MSRENSENIYGVIRWIGLLPSTTIFSVGIELEDEQEQQTNDDGAINGARLFTCPPGRALFVQPEQCSADRRFQDVRPPSTAQKKLNDTEKRQSESFGHMDCPIVEGSVPPLSKHMIFSITNDIKLIWFNGSLIEMVKLQELENICGKFKGIQGHYNSCYLDATLFAMFTFTCVFDTLLFRPPTIEVSQVTGRQNLRSCNLNSKHFFFHRTGHCQLCRSTKSITRRNRESIAEESIRARRSCDEIASIVGKIEFGDRIDVRREGSRGIFKFLAHTNHEGGTIFEAEFRPRCILLSAVCRERRTSVVADGAAIVRTEFSSVGHQIEGSAVVSDHTNAAIW